MKTGKAEKKLREIIAAQGGPPEIKPEDIEVGPKKANIHSKETGRIQWINNRAIAQIARVAGAPKTKGAGVLLKKKMGDKVKREETLFQIYSKNTQKLNSAILLAKTINPMGITGKFGEKMLIDRIPSKKIYIEKPLILER